MGSQRVLAPRNGAEAVALGVSACFLAVAAFVVHDLGTPASPVSGLVASVEVPPSVERHRTVSRPPSASQVYGARVIETAPPLVMLPVAQQAQAKIDAAGTVRGQGATLVTVARGQGVLALGGSADVAEAPASLPVLGPPSVAAPTGSPTTAPTSSPTASPTAPPPTSPTAPPPTSPTEPPTTEPEPAPSTPPADDSGTGGPGTGGPGTGGPGTGGPGTGGPGRGGLGGTDDSSQDASTDSSGTSTSSTSGTSGTSGTGSSGTASIDTGDAAVPAPTGSPTP